MVALRITKFIVRERSVGSAGAHDVDAEVAIFAGSTSREVIGGAWGFAGLAIEN